MGSRRSRSCTLRRHKRNLVRRLGSNLKQVEKGARLRTHLGGRGAGHLFETNRRLSYSPRRIQQIVKATAAGPKIRKRVYPHLLRHSVATTLLERGMPIDQIQKFLGHSKLETTQAYAGSTTEMIKESYRRALSG